MFTKEQQKSMLQRASRASSMDGHIVATPPATMAERAMTWFGGKKTTPRKNSYLYMEAEKAVRAAAETLGLDADLMIAEAEGLARATTFSNVEALYFVADQAASGKREVNGHA